MVHGDPGRPVDETSAAMLQALFTSSPVGLHLLDPDLRVVRLNTATPATRGVAPDDVVGRPIRDVYRMVEGNEAEIVLQDVLETGEPLWQHIIRARIKGEEPEHRYFEITALRLEGGDHKVLGLAVTVIDVTERELSRSRAEVLDAVRRQVGRTLDPAVTGSELVSALVPEFADVAIVEVVDSVIRGDEPPPAPMPPGTPLMRTAFRSGEAHPPQAFPVGEVRRLPAPTPFTQALSDLRPRVVPLRPGAPWMPVDPARTEAMHSSRSHTLLVVPLALRDAVLGLVSLYRAGEVAAVRTRATRQLGGGAWPRTPPWASTNAAPLHPRAHRGPPRSSVSCCPAGPRPTPRWRPRTCRSRAPIRAPGTTRSPCPGRGPRWWSATSRGGG
ncbi:PAS domain-containing protein [Streptomyces sp. e14]|uniref:PAS domain-containing protein n=1 Tax=Streptomyces sp. e14 TaxID=645465 RepID=UPI00031DF4C3|nr:PAS domain-containing protein [Streptomyces sp. e14]